ncbi:sugar ABC transporter ATP-binding protein [Arthrobacter sp. Marseille-P9274]|uniref:sugar ABC transporter ATP-binding protein n=1 Tax=Arthrobacter sp. Marseille-P9274 TaxID=2866572 RepID=UPI0021C84D1A|nr:sugar ABC transporter ATP-binding protein [Arthrobacter sp. Marseille-P9274]
MDAKLRAPEAQTRRRGPCDVLLDVRSLSKRFGPTVAVREASFNIRAGEVHALVGENGSGKSTLVKILSGVHAPNSGEIVIGGTSYNSFASPRNSQQAGIVTVFQEVLSVGSRTVLDNLWLGADGTFTTKVRKAEKSERARTVLAELLEHPPRLDARVEDLSLSDRQVCSIARALLRKPKILILDEATSALDYDSRTRLFRVVRRLCDEGVGIMLITHRMDEIEEIGDRITVLRSGVTVGTVDDENWTTEQLVEMMTGSDHLAPKTARAETREHDPSAPVVLETRGLTLAPGRSPINAQIRAGELVGLAGLEGQGQDAFLKALAGLGTSTGRVVRKASGGEAEILDREAAHSHRIAYVPRERRGESLFEWMSILDNFSIATVHEDSRSGFLSPRAAARRFGDYVSQLSIKTGNTANAITTLSGGNQQKVVIARWLATKPEILLLNDPTRGIDINAKRDLYRLLGDLTAEGMAVVMLSTEVDEHIELMDRVLVFDNFECTHEFQHSELTRQNLVASFFGKESRDEHGIG